MTRFKIYNKKIPFGRVNIGVCKISLTFPSSSFISKLTSKTYIKLRASDRVVIDALMSAAEAIELVIERGKFL